MTRVPVATVSRYATPRNSRNVSFASVVAEGATMPSTEPSSVTALARKSGWAQVSARLVRVPTLNSTPTSPSGAMTGSPDRAPLPRPTPRSSVRSEVGPLWRSTSAGRVANAVRAGRASSARSRSFSARRAGSEPASSAIESRSAWTARNRARLVRPSAASCCNQRSGTSAVSRSPSPSRRPNRVGSAIAPTERRRQSRNRRVSLREVARPGARFISRGQHTLILLVVVEDAAGAAHHAGERVVVHVDREAGLLLQKEVEPADQGAAPGHDDAAIDDVAGQLRRGDLERPAHRVHDLLDRLLDRLADFGGVNSDRLGDAGDQVSPLHLHLALVARRIRPADLDLDRLGGGLAHQEVVVLPHEP